MGLGANVVGVVVIIAAAFGLVAGSVANSRGLSFWLYFLVGAVTGVIGIVLAAVIPSGSPAVPAQWSPDPWYPRRLRWWDGRQWTGHTWPAA